MPVLLLFAYVFSFIGAYMAMYLCATMSALRGSNTPLNPLNVVRVVRELIGAILSLKGNTFRLTRHSPWHLVFNVKPSTCSREDISLAEQVIKEYMRSKPWRYPPSQFEALQAIVENAQLAMDTFEAIAHAEELLRAYREELKREAVRKKKSSGWRSVLGLNPEESDINAIKTAYRKKAKYAHPDHGGNNEEMAALNTAIAQARQELSFV